MRMTIDELLKKVSDGEPIASDVACENFFRIAYQCIRQREEINALNQDRDERKAKAEELSEVLQNLMFFLSVNGCRTEIDPSNAELRIRDGIDMLVRPVLARAEAAEAELRKAREQEPVAWNCGGDITQNNGYAVWFCAFACREVAPLYAAPKPNDVLGSI